MENGSLPHRIWLKNIRIMVVAGSFTAAACEKAVLALPCKESKTSFLEAHDDNSLVCPVLASVRVHVSKRKESSDRQSQTGGATEPTMLNAVVVEADDQVMDNLPTNTLLEQKPILQKLALSTDELKIATLSDFAVFAHIGMGVDSKKKKV